MTLNLLSELLDLLSEVFLDPEADLILRSRSLLDGLGDEPQIAGPLEKMVMASGSQGERSIEYVRLFLHGAEAKPVYPYESALLYGKLMHPQCLDSINSLYGRAGIRPNPNLKIPPDHIGLELEFTAFVIRRMGEAVSGEGEEEYWKPLVDDLMSDHLLKMVPVFTDRLSSLQPNDYYRSASELLKETISPQSRDPNGKRTLKAYEHKNQSKAFFT